MSRLSAARSSVLFLLSSLVSLSFLPVSVARDYCSINTYCGQQGDYCDCGTCYCDNNGYGSCGSCGWGGGTIAGTVIAIIVGVAILLCVCSLCYRRRYYANQGTTYNTGGPQPTVIMQGQSAVPMGAVPVGGYGSAPAMQAIPVQYSQYPQQQQQQQYGQQQQGYNTAYAQQPVGGGTMYPPQSELPPYTPQAPSAPGGENARAEGGYAEPYKPGRYEGERAL